MYQICPNLGTFQSLMLLQTDFPKINFFIVLQKEFIGTLPIVPILRTVTPKMIINIISNIVVNRIKNFTFLALVKVNR